MKNKILLAGASLTVAAVVAACASTISNDPVVLGAVYNLTGGQAGLDVPSSQGAQLAVKEANEAGGVLGRPVQLVIEDGQTDPVVVAAKVAAIIDQQPSTAALFGMSDTDPVLAAAPVAAANNRVFVTSGATSPKLPSVVPGYLYLACFGDNVQAAAGADWAYDDLAARTVAILYNSDSTYTDLLQGYFRTRFEELGGQVVGIADFAPGDDAAIAAAVASLPAADLVYHSATPDDVLAGINALRANGYDGPILSGDGFDVPDIWAANPDIANVFFTTHAYLGTSNPNPLVGAFREAYAAAYPDATPDAFAALGYDTARLLLQAVEDAGSDDPAAVRQALSEIQGFEGVTGEISYPAGSQIPVKSVSLLGVADGTVSLVEQVMPAGVPAP